MDKIVLLATQAAYPERSCRDHVWGDYQGYNCELADLHQGPCVSWSVRASLQRRASWEQQQAQPTPVEGS